MAPRFARISHHRHGGGLCAAGSVPDGLPRAQRGSADTFYVANAPSVPAGDCIRRAASLSTARAANVTIADFIQPRGPPHARLHRGAAPLPFRVHPGGGARLAAFRRRPVADRHLPPAVRDLLRHASSNNAAADTSLKRSMKLSLFPAAGVVADSTVTATVTLATAPAADLAVQFQTPNGNAALPASVQDSGRHHQRILHRFGLRAGVEEVTAVPADPAYETAFARVQVADASLLEAGGGFGRSSALHAGPAPCPIPSWSGSPMSTIWHTPARASSRRHPPAGA